MARTNPKRKNENAELHLTKEQIRALTTFLLGSQENPLPASYQYRPMDFGATFRRLVGGQEIQLHGLPPAHSRSTHFAHSMARYQGPTDRRRCHRSSSPKAHVLIPSGCCVS